MAIGVLRPNTSRLERLGAWFEAEYPRLLRFAYFLTADQAPAEDLVQEAFVRIYRAGGRLEEPQFPAYARRTILNLVRSTHRRRGREQRALMKSVQREHPPDPAERATHADVLRALFSLSKTGRACLALRFYEDMAEQDIADTLEMSLSAVKKQIERGLKTIRPLIGDQSVS